MIDQRILMQLAGLEQEVKQLEEKLMLIDQQITEMQRLDIDLEEIEKNKEKDILAGLGKGIFIKAKTGDKNLLVDVGSGIIVKKNIKETKQIIKEQIKKMQEFKLMLINGIEDTKQNMRNIIEKEETKQP